MQYYTVMGGMAVGPTRDEHCWEWGRKYMEYNLCSVKDGVSLTLGLVSVVSWGVAEIPQIITNYKNKSTNGLSLAFLMTWILGDLFNLFGCMLEPATLPTQYYMAMLYTITTAVLAVQTIYFGCIYPRLKHNLRQKKGSKSNLTEVRRSNTDFVGKQVNHAGRSIGFDTPSAGNVLSSPIPLPGICPSISPRRESYYISARSLSRSHTPTERSYLAQTTAPTFNHIRNSNEEPLLGALASTQSAPSNNIKTVLCVVSLMTLFGTFNHRSVDNKLDLIVENPSRGVVMRVGRRLLQVSSELLQAKGTKDSSGIGNLLGWGMAAIYIGGRLPQIFLNIRKGNVEGLNPLMFVFAVLGNATYVASIIVNSLDWSGIRPNLPWLVDAGGCMLLDIFILIQFLRYWRHQDTEGKDVHSNAA
ncbi:uncharacterized protein LOC110761401 isoform X3 [Prunus avium]|uniref:Uncharacterized protein LOC110761401 isoform X3 n=1 Tax=Prunus avium TaxID=42229 RepID=A0A6P5SRW4_PRUAV|nr:uncharacterized protein LOC110761401 isoform X3 [Prunus avium]